MKAAFVVIFGLLALSASANILECDACDFLVKTIDEYVAENNTLAVIERGIANICKYLPNSFSNPCDKILDLGVEEIIKFLEEYETPHHVCVDELKFCSSAKAHHGHKAHHKDLHVAHAIHHIKPAAPVAAPAAVKGNALECEGCTIIIGFIESKAAENKTEAEIIKEVEKLCSLTQLAICDTIVEQYIPLIINYLEQKFTPAQICQKLTFCPSSLAAKAKPVADNLECAGCKFIVGSIEKWVASNQTEEQITAQLEKLCALIKSDVCTQIVDNYVAAIIQLLENSEDPTTICGQIGMCTSSKKAVVAAAKKVGDDLECSACTIIVGYIEKWVANNQTEEQITQSLEKLCALLPSTEAQVCTQIVDNYVATIIQLIENSETPATVCAQIGLCTSSKKAVAVSKLTKSNTQCALCAFIVSEAQKYVASSLPVDKIVALVQKAICGESQTCQDLVAAYLPAIISLLQQQVGKVDPQAICQKVGLCQQL